MLTTEEFNETLSIIADFDSTTSLLASADRSISHLMNELTDERVKHVQKDSVISLLRSSLAQSDNTLKLEQDICRKKLNKLRLQKWMGIGSGVLAGYVLAKALK